MVVVWDFGVSRFGFWWGFGVSGLGSGSGFGVSSFGFCGLYDAGYVVWFR